MKIFLTLSLAVASAIAPIVAMAGTPSCTLSKIEYLDFFNLREMRRSGVTGETLISVLKEELHNDEETRALIAQAESVYGRNILDIIQEFATAKFVSEEGNPAISIARIVSSPKLEIPELPEAPKITLGDRTFFKLPPQIVKLFPSYFLSRTSAIFARNSENALILATCLQSDSEMIEADFKDVEAETKKLLSTPGLLIFRRFPRHDVVKSGEGVFCPTIPEGDFSLVEKNGTVEISVVFRCLHKEEEFYMNMFVSRFKAMMTEAGKNQNLDKNMSDAILAVCGTMKISTDSNDLLIHLKCPSELFPAFLAWRNTHTKMRPLSQKPPSTTQK